MWKYIQAHYCMTCNLKFYHLSSGIILFKAGQVHNTETPLGIVFFRLLHWDVIGKYIQAMEPTIAWPHQPELWNITTLEELLIKARQVQDKEIHSEQSSFWLLQWTFTNFSPQNHGYLLVYSHLGVCCLIRPISDLSLLQHFPNLHQLIKLLTFCINTRPHYFLGTLP